MDRALQEQEELKHESQKCLERQASLTEEARKRDRVEAGIQSVRPYKREKYDPPRFGITMEQIVRAGLLLWNAEKTGEVVLGEEDRTDGVKGKKLEYDSRAPWIDNPKNRFTTSGW